MGKVTTPKYRIELSGWNYLPGETKRVSSIMAWDSHYGNPTSANIEKYVNGMTASYMPGGANEHIGKDFGYIPVPSRAKIVNQRTGEIVADWKAPAFMVLPESPKAAQKERKTTYRAGRRTGGRVSRVTRSLLIGRLR